MRYLSAPEILYIHYRLVEELGGVHGVANPNNIKRMVHYSHNNEMFIDKFSKAGALLFAIARKKPFNSLNIQTGLMVANMFLKNNGQNFDPADPEIATFIKIFLPKAKLEEVNNFIKAKSSPIKS